ncbi:MAG: TetR/AcrR family transcriptional regulator [Bdellovibrionaceae bacterium]|jgi:AcrR family transcriptional regulator|nr:TetR/AcrR family transcriptional regulator [Pseudobdellovibrionaceae bacterium]
MEKLTKGQRTQHLIIENTLKLIGSDGFNNVSIQSIANNCGISQTAVLNHFKNKQTLFSEVRKFVRADNYQYVDSQMKTKDNAFERLCKHFDGTIEWGLKYKESGQIVILSYYHGCYDEMSKEVVKEIVEMAEERILSYVYSGLRESIFSFSDTPEDVSSVIHSYILGAYTKSISSSKSTKISKVDIRRNRIILKNILGYKG